MRRSVASLRSAGHVVALLAPASSGSVLVGPGPSEADRFLPWDRAEVASLLTEAGPAAGPFRDELCRFDLAVVYSRNAALVRNLGALVPRALAHDPLPPADAGHASEWLAEPLRSLGLGVSASPAPLLPTGEEQARALDGSRDLPAHFLAVHPGSGSAAKNWPAERFAALVERLASGRRWLLIEGPADERAATPLRSLAGGRHARDVPPRILGAILARAGVYVGNDSGVSHLAAAFGAPTVALFGPTDPRVWAPVGDRVRLVRAPDGQMESLDAAEVVEAVTAIRRG